MIYVAMSYYLSNGKVRSDRSLVTDDLIFCGRLGVMHNICVKANF
jgi:hypothetical protein